MVQLKFNNYVKLNPNLIIVISILIIDVEALNIDTYTENKWQKCVRTFELSLIPADDRLSEIIKSRLLAVKEDPALVIFLFLYNTFNHIYISLFLRC